jgi:glucokinase
VSNVLSVDIGGTRFRVGLFDFAGRRLEVLEGETSREGGRVWMLEQIQDRAGKLLERSKEPVGACGISFGGPVDFDKQVVRSLHVPGWYDFPLARWVEDTLHVPCRLDNDANAGALGEHQFGAGRGTRSMFYVTLSTGIGGGIVLDGRVLRGKDCLAGELGHISVSDAGVLCSCGAHGCLETFCSGTAIATRARDWVGRRPESAGRMLELSGGEIEMITAQSVASAAAEGDLLALEIIEEVSHWLARAVLIVIRILNPDRIILGGGVARAGKVLLNPVLKGLDSLASPTIGYSTEVVLAELENYSPLFGAAALALEMLRETNRAS